MDSAPIMDSLSNRSPEVSSSMIGVLIVWRISPASSFCVISMVQTPVSVSPFWMALWTGAAPRYLGRREKCIFMDFFMIFITFYSYWH